jgi:hypothetical protein
LIQTKTNQTLPAQDEMKFVDSGKHYMAFQDVYNQKLAAEDSFVNEIITMIKQIIC